MITDINQLDLNKRFTYADYLTEKFDLYQNTGVKEYWIVHPSEATVIPYRLDADGQYQLIRNRPFVKDEFVPVGVFPDFSIDLNEIFN